MSRSRIVGLVVLVVFAFLLVRVYGAFRLEHDTAIERAKKADAQAAQLVEEHNRLEARLNCSMLWFDYNATQLGNVRREVRGIPTVQVSEPSCGEYSGMNERVPLETGVFRAYLEAVSARQYAIREWRYADNWRVQARYLHSKLLATLKGTKPPFTQAELQGQWQEEQRARLRR